MKLMANQRARMKNRMDKLRKSWAIQKSKLIFNHIVLIRRSPELFKLDSAEKVSKLAEGFINEFCESSHITHEQFVQWFPELVQKNIHS